MFLDARASTTFDTFAHLRKAARAFDALWRVGAAVVVRTRPVACGTHVVSGRDEESQELYKVLSLFAAHVLVCSTIMGSKWARKETLGPYHCIFAITASTCATSGDFIDPLFLPPRDFSLITAA